MPRSGATYTLPAGYLATTGETATATQHNSPLADIATALTNSVSRDGAGSMSGNLNMGTSYRITNLAVGSARTDSIRLSQVQDSTVTYAADSGAADAYVVTLSPAITAYATGMKVRFLATNANTGASTLNVNSVGATAIRKNVSDALEADDIAAGKICEVVYDGTYWILLNPTTSLTPTTFATAAQFRADAAGSIALSPAAVWDAAAVVSLTSSSNQVAWNMATGINFNINTLGENTTIQNPTNSKGGQSGYLRIIQDATGGRVVSWGSNFLFAGGIAPTNTTTANSSDVFFYVCFADGTVLITSVLDIS